MSGGTLKNREGRCTMCVLLGTVCLRQLVSTPNAAVAIRVAKHTCGVLVSSTRVTGCQHLNELGRA